MNNFTYLLLLLTGLLHSSMQDKDAVVEEEQKSRVVMFNLSDPGELTPNNASDAAARMVHHHLFQPLLNVYHKTNKLVPVLLVKRPDFTTNADGTITANMGRNELYKKLQEVIHGEALYIFYLLRNSALR